MRWPLRNQVLLPMVCVVLAALVSVSALNAYFTARHARIRIEHELDDAAKTVTDAEFPLTDAVLKKMRGLSGAEFIVIDREGAVVASSSAHDAFHGLEYSPSRNPPELGKPVSLADGRFFHTALEMRRPVSPGRPATLHILYPEQSYQEAWRDAVIPPLAVGAIATVLVIAFGLAISSRVTRPLRRLQIQAGEIAEGDFQSMPVPARDDEIADLSRSINQMAAMLAKYETDVRKNERLCTLGQLGSGIAHQMRNSVTGCRLAVELHARECNRHDDESVEVAKRQLALMERYLQRFLSLGQSEERQHVPTDLVQVVDNVVSLVQPTARHVRVELVWDRPDKPAMLSGDADSLEQMLVNLVINAVEAASRGDVTTGATPKMSTRSANRVSISLRRQGEKFLLVVSDTGDGPAEKISGSVFEPFVTAKPDGTGLGLSVARQVAQAHGGDIRWERSDAVTHFIVELSAMPEPMDQREHQRVSELSLEERSVETAGRR